MGNVDKGKDGEREVANLLRQELGIEIKRNLDQAREGGADLLGIPGWVIEVKRAEEQRVKGWWQKLTDHAIATGYRPALFYRENRRPWRVVLAVAHVIPTFSNAPLHLTVETSIDVFTAVIREELAGLDQAPSP